MCIGPCSHHWNIAAACSTLQWLAESKLDPSRPLPDSILSEMLTFETAAAPASEAAQPNNS